MRAVDEHSITIERKNDFVLNVKLKLRKIGKYGGTALKREMSAANLLWQRILVEEAVLDNGLPWETNGENFYVRKHRRILVHIYRGMQLYIAKDMAMYLLSTKF